MYQMIAPIDKVRGEGRTALSLLRRELTAKVGIKNKRLNAAWNETYLEKVLFTK